MYVCFMLGAMLVVCVMLVFMLVSCWCHAGVIVKMLPVYVCVMLVYAGFSFFGVMIVFCWCYVGLCWVCVGFMMV